MTRSPHHPSPSDGPDEVDGYELEAIRLEFVAAHERCEPLNTWIRRYPQYATVLIDLAIDLDADAAPVAPAEADTARIGAVMRQAVQQVQQARLAAQPTLVARAQALKVSIPELAKRLQLTPDLLVKLDQGYIRLETVPRRFLAHVAQGLQTTVEALLAGLQPRRTPNTAAGMAFYTKGRPGAAQQQSFAEALGQARGLPAAERARWLAVVREEGLAS